MAFQEKYKIRMKVNGIRECSLTPYLRCASNYALAGRERQSQRQHLQARQTAKAKLQEQECWSPSSSSVCILADTSALQHSGHCVNSSASDMRLQASMYLARPWHTATCVEQLVRNVSIDGFPADIQPVVNADREHRILRPKPDMNSLAHHTGVFTQQDDSCCVCVLSLPFRGSNEVLH